MTNFNAQELESMRCWSVGIQHVKQLAMHEGHETDHHSRREEHNGQLQTILNRRCLKGTKMICLTAPFMNADSRTLQSDIQTKCQSEGPRLVQVDQTRILS